MTDHSLFQIAFPETPMSARTTVSISTRKQPQQARSTGLVASVLDAAVQVLATEGAHRFTTARVAQKAGVSVGSLYQYFPNKAAILFRLQSDEWQRTSALLRDILQDSKRLPLDRMRVLVETFIRSECEEAGLRAALDDAAPLYRDAPEAVAAKESGSSIFRDFVREVLPSAPDKVRQLTADLIEMTLTQGGKNFSESPRSSDEIAEFANAMSNMFCAYLSSLGGGRPAPEAKEV